MRWLALCLFITGCGQSCEERGGVQIQTGVTTIIQSNGKFFYPMQYPVYECVIKEKNNG
jgi:hypothetical protein